MGQAGGQEGPVLRGAVLRGAAVEDFPEKRRSPQSSRSPATRRRQGRSTLAKEGGGARPEQGTEKGTDLRRPREGSQRPQRGPSAEGLLRSERGAGPARLRQCLALTQPRTLSRSPAQASSKAWPIDGTPSPGNGS